MLVKYDRDNSTNRRRDVFSIDPIFRSLEDFFWPFEHDFGSLTSIRSYGSDSYQITTDESGMTLSVDLPGVKKDSLNVESRDGNIYVEGTRAGKKINKKFSIDQRYERVPLDASFEDGVLTMKFELLPHLRPRAPVKIEVK